MARGNGGVRGSASVSGSASVLAWASALGALAVGAAGCGGCGDGPPSTVFPDAAVEETPTCTVAGGTDPVAEPAFVRNLPGNTAWYSSPAIADLDGDGRNEIVAPFYDVFVYDDQGNVLDQEPTDVYHYGRVYAPAVVADLDGDGVTEVVVGGSNGSVADYEFVGGGLSIKPGWPVTACNGSACDQVEVRGMAADDLDGDGTIEIVVTNTETDDLGAQVWVFEPDGTIYDVAGTAWDSWPRYNDLTGPGNDADANGMGHDGYGCYGLNVGTGNIDDDPDVEIIVTYDNHQINAFNPDGTSITASSYFTNRATEWENLPLDWGQFIRYLDPAVEEAHYDLHTGEWPGPSWTPWLQWTASPPSVADVDGDGDNEVIGVPNVEENEPYETIAHAFMVLEGSYGDGSRSARRLAGWEELPETDHPWARGAGDWYPPDGVPAPSVASILGDTRPEIVAPGNDGFMYGIGPDADLLWRFNYAMGAAKTFASEATIADLNRDGRPEVIFTTYALRPDAGRLVVLANTGALLYDVTLPAQGDNGNGIGGPAAPTVGDVDGDGALEVLVMTFDHGLDVFTVAGSGDNCLPWPTGRGNLLRNGRGPAYVGP
jgi:hypothetical protein